jgi:hypothetical protein
VTDLLALVAFVLSLTAAIVVVIVILEFNSD